MATGPCFVASTFFPSSPALLLPVRQRTNANPAIKQQRVITNHQDNFTSFSSSLGTDLPLREHSQVPFQTYLQDRQRVFEALFPDKKRCEKLNDKEWRIYMLPLEFLFLSVNPVVDMRIVVQQPNLGHPVAIPKDVERVLTLEATKWQLRGLDYVLKPSDFVLSINGILFSEKRGASSRLRGHLTMNVKFAIPPSLSMIPHEAFKSVGEAVLTRLLESMKEKVNSKLLKDYRAYAREVSQKAWQLQLDER